MFENGQDSGTARRAATASVVRALVSLLTQFGETEKVAFLTQQLGVLEDEAATAATLIGARRELHRVVLGMGGLMDLHLQGRGAERANAEMRRLAEQLYPLTD